MTLLIVSRESACKMSVATEKYERRLLISERTVKSTSERLRFFLDAAEEVIALFTSAALATTCWRRRNSEFHRVTVG